jgi:hypothetical protein
MLPWPLPKCEHVDTKSQAQLTTTMGPFFSAMFFSFLRSCTQLGRLVTEIRTALDTEGNISIDGKLQRYEYLWTCVNELFRLILTITNPLFRTIFPGGVKDGFFEQGTKLGCSTFKAHRNERYAHSQAGALPRVCGGEEAVGEALCAFQQGKQDLRGPVTGFHSGGADDCAGRVVLRYVADPRGLLC